MAAEAVAALKGYRYFQSEYTSRYNNNHPDHWIFLYNTKWHSSIILIWLIMAVNLLWNIYNNMYFNLFKEKYKINVYIKGSKRIWQWNSKTKILSQSIWPILYAIQI